MKRSDMAQQVEEAQNSVRSWSPEKREDARLEGWDIYTSHQSSQHNCNESIVLRPQA